MITPNKDEFRQLAKQGNLIPVCRDIVADMETPVSAYKKITAPGADGKDNTARSFLLESVEGGENIARYSFVGVEPRAVFIQKNGQAELLENGSSEKITGANAFERLRRVLNRYQPVRVPGLPPFIGGAVGYAAYDVISEVEPTVPVPPVDPLGVPEAVFMVTESILVFDRVKQTIRIISHAHVTSEDVVDQAYDTAIAKINALADKLRRPLEDVPVDPGDGVAEPVYQSNKTREEYKQIVRAAKEYILAGDIIQVVPSQRFTLDMPSSPLAVYRALRVVNPSPYMFLLNYGDFSLVGASPEVHAKCSNREVTVRPIAGTRKRGVTEVEDLALEKELLADPKERAEHIMLVDLARNDIGRIANIGTVRVHDLMMVERYSHVMHIVSDVKGELANDLEADSVMASTFPAGTLSGAPKVRAMQIISELEGEKRGPYGGAVAYCSFDGNIDSCITIRSATLKDGKAYVQAGGGVVADSDPDAEYEETVNKAKALMKALAMAKRFDA